MFGDTNLFAIFITGLLTGGLTCIAVQGGLLTTALVQKDRYKIKDLRLKNQGNNLLPTIAFIVAKLIAYTILGFILGWAGSLIQISLQGRIILQFAVVIFMLGTALNLLNVHPIFRYFAINPPKFLTNVAYGQSGNKNWFAPSLLGFLTIFIPCGATQAMMALAVASGNPLLGAITMFVFVLGTSPVFLLLGLLTLKLKGVLNRRFIKIAAFLLIILSLFNLDASLALANSPYTISSVVREGYCVLSYCGPELTGQAIPVTEQTITFSPTGYSPNHFVIRAGTKVTLNLINKNASGCIQSFTISSLNIQKIVLPDTTETVEFTAPDEPGRITFTCSTGLYPGTIEII